jgi:hypothetical protein
MCTLNAAASADDMRSVIRIQHPDPSSGGKTVLAYLRIVGGFYDDYGAGISITDSNVDIVGCEISNNHAPDASRGGGLCVHEDVRSTLTHKPNHASLWSSLSPFASFARPSFALASLAHRRPPPS